MQYKDKVVGAITRKVKTEIMNEAFVTKPSHDMKSSTCPPAKKLSRSYAEVLGTKSPVRNDSTTPVVDSTVIISVPLKNDGSLSKIDSSSDTADNEENKKRGQGKEKSDVVDEKQLSKKAEKCATSSECKEPKADEDTSFEDFSSDMSSAALRRCIEEVCTCQDDHLYFLSDADESVVDSETGERVRRFKNPNTKVYDEIKVPVCLENGEELPEGYLDRHARGIVERKNDERYHKTSKNDNKDIETHLKEENDMNTHTRSYSKVGPATRSRTKRTNRKYTESLEESDDDTFSTNTRNPYAKHYIKSKSANLSINTTKVMSNEKMSPEAHSIGAKKLPKNSKAVKNPYVKPSSTQGSNNNTKSHSVVKNPYVKSSSTQASTGSSKTSSIVNNPYATKSTTASKLKVKKSPLDNNSNQWLETNKGKRKRVSNPYVKRTKDDEKKKEKKIKANILELDVLCRADLANIYHFKVVRHEGEDKRVQQES